jgi:hypothetical protein
MFSYEVRPKCDQNTTFAIMILVTVVVLLKRDSEPFADLSTTRKCDQIHSNVVMSSVPPKAPAKSELLLIKSTSEDKKLSKI